MDFPWAQIGNATPAAKPAWDLGQLWPLVLATAAVLAVGFVVIVLVDRWRKGTVVSGDQLSHFQALYDQGQLSREEFEQIRGLLLGKFARKGLDSSALSSLAQSIQTRTAKPRWESPASEESSPGAEGIQPRPPDPPANGAPPG